VTPTAPHTEPGLGSYLTGFFLALVLTGISFALVVFDVLPRSTDLVVIAVAAVAQILVHLRYFLHLGLTTTPRENLVVLLFAGVLIFIMIGGSLWIMFDLRDRMMG